MAITVDLPPREGEGIQDIEDATAAAIVAVEAQEALSIAAVAARETDATEAGGPIDLREDQAITAVAGQETTSVAAVTAQGVTSVAAVVTQQGASVTAVAAQQTTSVTAVVTQQTTSVAAVVTEGDTQDARVTAEGDTQVARVAGTPGSTMYADTTAGLAGTASGSYFLVVGTGDTVATVYKDNAGVAEIQEAFPSVDGVAATTALADALSEKIGGDQTAVDVDIGVTPVTASAMPGGYVYASLTLTRTGKLKRFRIWIANVGTGAGSIVILTKSGTTGTIEHIEAITGISGTGLKTYTAGVDFPEGLEVSAGQMVGWYATATGSRPAYTASGQGYVYASAAAPADGASFTLTSAAQTYHLDCQVSVMPDVVEARLDDIDEDLSNISDTQLIGYSGTIPDGTFTTTSFSTNRYFHAEKASAPGRVSRLLVYTSAAGTVYIQKARIVAGVMTWVGAEYAVTIAGAGLNTIDLTEYEIDMAEGDLIALRGAILRLTTSSTTRGFGGGYFVVTADSTTLTAGPVVNALLHWRFEIIHQRTRLKHQRQILTIRGSDKIVVVGTSYGADEFTLKSKWWGQKVSNLTDWRIENWSYGGSTAQSIVDFIQVRSYVGVGNANVSFLDYGASHALIRNTENDGSYSENNTRVLIDTVVSCGIVPIVASEHRNVWGTTTMVAHGAMANYADGYLLDGVTHPQNVSALIDFVDNGSAYGSYTGAFYYGQATNVPHLNVRANDIAAWPVEEFIRKQLGRPRKSLRIFRIRPLFDGTAPTVADIADLKFNTHFDRTVIWKEIDSAHWCLPTAHEKYLDDILNHSPLLAIGDFQKIESEYLSLQFGRTIALTDYTLIEGIHPALHGDTETYALQISDAAATVYVWDRLKHPSNATYPSETLPAGNWKQVPVDANGYAYVQGKDIPGTVMRDKVQFLIYKSGGIAAFAEPRLHVWGEPRYRDQPKYPTNKPTGTELITTTCPSTGSAIATGWTATAAPTYGTGIQNVDLPRGAVGHAVVTSANKVSFAMTLAADTTAAREMEVSVVSTVDPALFASATDTYPRSGCISNNTFDAKKLLVEIGYGGTFVAFKGVAGTWWRPSMFRVPVPRGASNPTIRISAESGTILVALASCKVV